MKLTKITLLATFLIYPYTGSTDLYAQVGSSYAGDPISTATILENPGFTVGYSEELKDPIWVSYKVFPVDKPEKLKRPSRFKTDERTEAKVKHDDYTNTGYDRGHMAPNDAIATCYGREAQLATFYMSNICPQTPQLNRQIWKRLEQTVLNEYTEKFDKIWVITGPVFDNEHDYLQSGVDIPDAFYKILVDEEDGNPRMLAFIIPQNVVGNEDFGQFIVSVDSVESVTGIDFFSELDDQLEDSLEDLKSEAIW